MEDNFLATFYGKYSTSVYSRTNAIGMPLNYQKKFIFISEILTLFDDSLLQNNISENNVSYDHRNWDISHIILNGKMVYWILVHLYLLSIFSLQYFNAMNIFHLSYRDTMQR
jgi:hypothetical protein